MKFVPQGPVVLRSGPADMEASLPPLNVYWAQLTGNRAQSVLEGLELSIGLGVATDPGVN